MNVANRSRPLLRCVLDYLGVCCVSVTHGVSACSLQHVRHRFFFRLPGGVTVIWCGTGVVFLIHSLLPAVDMTGAILKVEALIAERFTGEKKEKWTAIVASVEG